ncbi:hypothetical protein [Aegicerativicinus sediminis]|uniref:hypothetical protein n=1 Tax=Aegicerativicinus sediminis TaxID=2893202 RepID=UPI001E3E46C1|nr:hypothetical protein [Aegicerativicinus sediminis]
MKRLFNYFCLPSVFLVSILLISCGASNTKMTGSWKNPDVTPKKYESVFIVFIGGNQQLKQQVEDELAARASLKGLLATKSKDVFKPTFGRESMPEQEELLSEIRESGAQAIFTVALKDKETTTRYVPGTTTYYPLGFRHYGRFYGYYANYYPMGYDPGYYKQDNVYYLESNLYDVETEELLWSAQSKTYNPSNFESFVKGYTEALIEQLIKDGLIKP